jgi:putative SOS response-associated peptidase YedK
MCGRFVRFTSWAELRRTLSLLTAAELPPSYNVAPTQQVLVAREQDGQREGVAMRWGLIPSWAKDKKTPQINARAETAAEKPMFRAAFKKRRCLIVADGYYEWKKGGQRKQPFFFRLKGEQPLAFAGLWETWHGEAQPLETCAILTTTANELAKEVHDRMPVILTGDEAKAWLDSGVADSQALVGLLRPFAAERMEIYPVSMRVNKVSENDAGLIVPAIADPTTQN